MAEKDFDGTEEPVQLLLASPKCGYRRPKDDRRVQPETHNVSRPSIRSIVDVFHAGLDDAALRLDLRHDGPPRGLQAARGRRRDAPAAEPERSARGPATLATTRPAASDEASCDQERSSWINMGAAAASGLASWHSSQDAASAALRAKHRLQRHPTAGRVNRNGRAAFSPKFGAAGRGA